MLGGSDYSSIGVGWLRDSRRAERSMMAGKKEVSGKKVRRDLAR
jgi:hypothetical protein